MRTTVARPVPSLPEVCDLLCVDIGAERFALPLSTVEEVVDGTTIERTSGVGNYNRNMVGVMRLRQELLPVFDASKVLNVQRCAPDYTVLVLEGSAGLIGVLVDGAEAAPQISLADVRTPQRLMSIDRVLDGVLFVRPRWVGLVNTASFVEALEREAHERESHERESHEFHERDMHELLSDRAHG